MKQRVFLYSGDCAPIFQAYSDWVDSKSLRQSVINMIQHYIKSPFTFSPCLKTKNIKYNSYTFRPSISEEDYAAFKSIKNVLRKHVDGHIGSMSHGMAELALVVMCIYSQSNSVDENLLRSLFIRYAINPALLERGVFDNKLKEEWLNLDAFPNAHLLEENEISLGQLAPSEQLIIRSSISTSGLKPAWSLGDVML